MYCCAALPRRVRAGRDQAARRSARVLDRRPHRRALRRGVLHRQHRLAPRADGDEMLISTPTGQGVAQIVRQGDAVLLKTAEPREYRDATPRRSPSACSASACRSTGWPTGCRASLRRSSKGRGWKVEYQEYDAERRPDPRLRLTYPGLELRLAISSSGTEAGTPRRESSISSCTSSAARADGYHELQTVFRLIDRADRVGIAPRDDGEDRVRRARSAKTTFACAPRAAEGRDRPPRAATSRSRRTCPVGGGLGGGSSDAATVLLVLNQAVGSWAWAGPSCSRSAAAGRRRAVLRLRPQRARRRHRRALTALDLPPAWYLVLTPQVSVSTKGNL